MGYSEGVVGLVESRWVHYRIRSRFFALGELEIFVAVGEGGEGGEGDEQGEEVVLWRFAPSELADEVHRLPWLGAVPPHPGVLDVRNVFEADGSVYIAFERVRARDLFEWLYRRGEEDAGYRVRARVPLGSAIALVLRLAEAVGHFRSHDLPMRGVLSPFEVLLTEAGDVRCVPPGPMRILQALQTSCVGHPATDVRLLARFGAPEAVLGEPHATSDTFALALLLHELVTGEHPAGGTGTSLEFLGALRDARVPRLGAFLPDCPPELDAALARALERDPACRTRTPEELAAALADAARRAAIDVSRVAMPPLEAAWAPKPWLSRSFFAPDEADGEIGGVVRGVARQPLPHGIRTRDTPVDALPTSSGPRSLGARVRDAVASALRRREP